MSDTSARWCALVGMAILVLAVVLLLMLGQKDLERVCAKHGETFISVQHNAILCADVNGVVTMRKNQ